MSNSSLRGRRCRRPFSAQQQPLEDGLDDLVAVHRHRHRDAQGVADGLVLAQQDIQHDAVDLVVRAVVGEDA